MKCAYRGKEARGTRGWRGLTIENNRKDNNLHIR